MKQLVLFSTLLGLVACQSGSDVTPVSLTGELAGTYQTNGFMNYLYLALPSNQIPTVIVQATKKNTLTLTLIQSFPEASVQTLTGITIVREADQSIYLVQAGQVIGSFQTSRVFNSSGMAIQGKLLRLSALQTDFIGYRP